MHVLYIRSTTTFRQTCCGRHWVGEVGRHERNIEETGRWNLERWRRGDIYSSGIYSDMWTSLFEIDFRSIKGWTAWVWNKLRLQCVLGYNTVQYNTCRHPKLYIHTLPLHSQLAAAQRKAWWIVWVQKSRGWWSATVWWSMSLQLRSCKRKMIAHQIAKGSRCVYVSVCPSLCERPVFLLACCISDFCA